MLFDTLAFVVLHFWIILIVRLRTMVVRTVDQMYHGSQGCWTAPVSYGMRWHRNWDDDSARYYCFAMLTSLNLRLLLWATLVLGLPRGWSSPHTFERGFLPKYSDMLIVCIEGLRLYTYGVLTLDANLKKITERADQDDLRWHLCITISVCSVRIVFLTFQLQTWRHYPWHPFRKDKALYGVSAQLQHRLISTLCYLGTTKNQDPWFQYYHANLSNVKHIFPSRPKIQRSDSSLMNDSIATSCNTQSDTLSGTKLGYSTCLRDVCLQMEEAE